MDEKKNPGVVTEMDTAENTEAIAEAVEGEVVEEGNVVRLSRSLRGKDELVFSFDKIKGSTLLRCEKRAKETDASIVVPQLSMVFQAHVAAAACGLKYDEIINLPGPDFLTITLKVSRFLSGAEQ